MSDVIVNRGRVLSQPLEFDPQDFRAICYTHPNSERVRWWKAYPQLPLSRGVTSQAKWSHVEQDVSAFRAIVQGERIARRYFPEAGQILSGDLFVTTMPDEIPLSDHDWIMPIGRFQQGDETLPDARTFTWKERLTRGAVLVDKAGTVSSSGTNVTGSGTAFTADFTEGSVIQAGGQAFVVTAVTDDTHLAVESAPTPAWNGHDYSSGVETLLRTPAAEIVEIFDDQRAYNVDVDVRLASDGQTIEWLSAVKSPPAGGEFTIVYNYYPKYVVMPDLGRRRHGVRGLPLPQSVVCRLWSLVGEK
jgi:hypothetical protein